MHSREDSSSTFDKTGLSHDDDELRIEEFNCRLCVTAAPNPLVGYLLPEILAAVTEMPSVFPRIRRVSDRSDKRQRLSRKLQE